MCANCWASAEVAPTAIRPTLTRPPNPAPTRPRKTAPIPRPIQPITKPLPTGRPRPKATSAMARRGKNARREHYLTLKNRSILSFPPDWQATNWFGMRGIRCATTKTGKCPSGWPTPCWPTKSPATPSAKARVSSPIPPYRAARPSPPTTPGRATTAGIRLRRATSNFRNE